MLADANAMATVAVKDLKTARSFYEGTLRLKPSRSEGADVTTYTSGGSSLVVYESRYAGSNQATTVTWGLGKEFDATIKSLQDAGVRFEHYDLPGGSRQGDVHVFGDFKAAWFKDPDGNILHVNSG
jgi:catechol-2,3-dioxygenase